MNKKKVLLILLSLFAGLVCAIAARNHITGFVNFPRATELIITIIVLCTGLMMYISLGMLNKIWRKQQNNHRKIVLIGICIIIIVFIMYYLYIQSEENLPRVPELASQQELEIFSDGSKNPLSKGADVTLIELKIGKKIIPLSSLERTGQWVENAESGYKGIILTGRIGSLKYHFISPSYQRVSLTFLSQDNGGIIKIHLGRRVKYLDLYTNIPREKKLTLKTMNESYLSGYIVIDLVAILFIFIILLPWGIPAILWEKDQLQKTLELERLKKSALFSLYNRFDLIICILIFIGGIFIGGNFYYVGKPYVYNPSELLITLSFPYIKQWMESAYFSYGLMFGITLILAYLIFRLGMGKIFASLCTLGFLISTNHLNNLLPSITRDYIKGPILMLIILLLGILIISTAYPKRLVDITVLLAIAAGFGSLVRPDIMIVIPFVLVVLFLFLPGFSWVHIKIKISLALVFICLFIVLNNYVCPVCKQDTGGGYANFYPIVGSLTPFDDHLGITRSGYDWGYLYLDQYDFADVITTKKFLLPNPSTSSGNLISRYKPKDSTDFLVKLIPLFPSDFLSRAYASIVNVLELPYNMVLPPQGIENDSIQTMYKIREDLLNALWGKGVLLFVIAYLILLFMDIRFALFYAFLVIYFGGYPAIQYQGRHSFYLEFIGWMNLGIIGYQIIQFFRKIIKRNITLNQFKTWSSLKLNILTLENTKKILIVLLSLLCLWIPLYTLRRVQTIQLQRIINEYQQAKKEEIPTTRIQQANGMILLMDTKYSQQNVDPENLKNILYMATFNQNSPTCRFIPINIRYSSTGIAIRYDFSRSITLSVPEQNEHNPIDIYFPLYYDNTAAPPLGIEIAPEQLECFENLSYIRDTYKLPMILTLFPSSAITHPYQRIIQLEENQIKTVPEYLEKPRIEKILSSNLTPITISDASYTDRIINFDGGEWNIRGYAVPQKNVFVHPNIDRTHSKLASVVAIDQNIAWVNTDLLITKEKWVTQGSALVAHGELYTGGIIIGLMRDGKPAGMYKISSRGKFDLLIEVEVDGNYQMGISNNLDAYTSLENRGKIKLGWVMAP